MINEYNLECVGKILIFYFITTSSKNTYSDSKLANFIKPREHYAGTLPTIVLDTITGGTITRRAIL